MPMTPDRPSGRPAGSEDEFESAETVDRASRETVPVEARGSTAERRSATGADSPDFDLIDLVSRDTVALESREARQSREASQSRETSHSREASQSRETEELRDRPTVTVDRGRREAGPGRDQHETVVVDQEALGRRATVKLPGQRKPVDGRKRPPLLVAAGFATLWAAFLSYLPVAAVIGLARTLEGSGGLAGAAHAGLAGWLLGHGVPIGTSIGPLALAPLLLTLLATWRLNRAGLHVTRAIGARHSGSIRTALRVAATIAIAYAILGWLAAIAVDGRGTDVSAARAAVNFFVLGLLASLIGALRSTDGLLVLARRMPPVLRHGLRTGLVAALLIVAVGAAFAGLSVAIGGGQAADMISAYRTGTAGQAGITLVSLAYGVNAAIWAAAYLLGPGFLLGTNSIIRLTDVTVGPLPTLPLLAGLPDGPMGATGALLLAVPVLIGMSGGWMLTRRLSQGRGHGAPKRPIQGGPARPGEPPHHSSRPAWTRVIGAALISGPVAGVVLGALSWLSSGSLGSGRLSAIGPVPWQVAVVTTAVIALSSTIGAAAGRAFRAGPPRP
jgi:hypothetical protein